MKAAATLGPGLDAARARWTALPPRERQLVLLAGGVIAVALLWLLALQPAWRTVREAPARLDALDAQLQAMQRLAAEATELRAAPAVSSTQSGAALKAASDRLGEQGRLVLQGDRAVLTLTGASTEQLRGWLAEARSGARARPVEANLTRGPKGYSGSIVVAVGGSS